MTSQQSSRRVGPDEPKAGPAVKEEADWPGDVHGYQGARRHLRRLQSLGLVFSDKSTKNTVDTYVYVVHDVLADHAIEHNEICYMSCDL